MPSLGESFHLLASHWWHGVAAAVLFAAGVATAVPVTHGKVHWLMAFPLWIVRKVLRLIGPEFAPWRVFPTIFVFNSVAMFVYMATGVLVIVPAAVAFLTGLNIGVVVLNAGELELPGGELPTADGDDSYEVAPWVSACGLAVLVLELPSFWISVGMGIGMGRSLAVGGPYTVGNITRLFVERAHAYWMIVVPVLLVSAVAETLAIRGHVRARASAGASTSGRHEDNEEHDDETPPDGH